MLPDPASEQLASGVSADAGSIAPLKILIGLLDHANEAHRFYAARALGVIAPTIIDHGDPQKLLDALAKHLEDPDPDVRHETMVAIRACAKPSASASLTEGLIYSLVFDPEIDVKCEAITVLAEWRSIEALPIIRWIAAFDLVGDELEIKASAEPIEITWDEIEGDIGDRLRAQQTAIRALSKIGNTDDAQMLISLALSDAAEDVGSLVCTVLARLGDTGRAGLVELAHRARPRVQRDAVGELGKCADSGQLIAMRKLFADRDPEVRAALVVAIGERSHDDSLLGIACRDSSSIVRSCAAGYVANDFKLIKPLLDDPQTSVRLAALKSLSLNKALHERLARSIDNLASDTNDSVIVAVPPALIAVVGAEARRPLHAWINSNHLPTGLRVSALQSLVNLERELDTSKQQAEWNKALALVRSMLTDEARDMRLCAIAVLADEANDGNSTAADHLSGVLGESVKRLVASQNDETGGATHMEIASTKIYDSSSEADGSNATKATEKAKSLSTLDSILNANDEVRHNNSATDNWKDSLDENEQRLLSTTAHWPKAKHISLDPDIPLDLDVARCITRASAGIVNTDLQNALVEALEFPDADLREGAAHSLSLSLSKTAFADNPLTSRIFDACKTLLNECKGNEVIATIGLLGHLPVNGAEIMLLSLLDHADPWRQLAALRALSLHPENAEIVQTKAENLLDHELTDLRHSAIQMLGQNDDTQSIQVLVDRLGAHAGADASVIGEILAATSPKTAQGDLCQLLGDSTRQREWRFATEALAACVLSSDRQ
jgi:HEAT repeat protein